LKLSALWDGKLLHVPPALLAGYRAVLAARNWVVAEHKGGVGGPTADHAKEHFCTVFQASACRQVALVCDPLELCTPIPSELWRVISTGQLRILDLASGAGPASLGLLSAIAALRISGDRPSFPLNVVIDAADYNTESLSLFDSIASAVEPALHAAGMEFTRNTVRWDATQTMETCRLIDRFLEERSAHDVLVLVSLISGTAGSNETYKEYRSSFEYMKLRILNRGTLLWIEPNNYSKAEWLLMTIQAFFTRVSVPAEARNLVRAEYNWYEPFSSSTSKVRIAALLVKRVPA
jgi:hypothetical protein